MMLLFKLTKNNKVLLVACQRDCIEQAMKLVGERTTVHDFVNKHGFNVIRATVDELNYFRLYQIGARYMAFDPECQVVEYFFDEEGNEVGYYMRDWENAKFDTRDREWYPEILTTYSFYNLSANLAFRKADKWVKTRVVAHHRRLHAERTR